MADFFVSYTSSDETMAHWIALELEKLGHVAHVHAWAVKAGDDIYAWMQKHLDAADHVLCVVSDAYMRAPYSTLERNAALWAMAKDRPGFVLMVVVKACRLPTLSDHYRRCDLVDLPEAVARERLKEFLAGRTKPERIEYPKPAIAVSNIPVRVPAHFLGRDDSLEAIHAALARYEGRVAITALHGLRGVGKTTLAAAYAQRHGGDYRATWWIRAQSEPGLRADLVGLGVRLGWVGAEDKEDPALATVMDQLRHQGEGILLIYDNALDAKTLAPYLPRGGAARVLVTSNAHAWRGIVAEPVEIRIWPAAIGADYLIARTGRAAERAAAEALSQELGGLPLAHEQAAAYCEQLAIGLAEYGKRFAAAPVQMLDKAKYAPGDYHDGLTVAKTFGLAIEAAARTHPAAEPLILHLALLPPEPVPLFLFQDGRAELGEALAPLLAGDGLDEAVAALRDFALVDREPIPDERDPAVQTDTLSLHRLVREVAAARLDAAGRDGVRRHLLAAMAAVYPAGAFDNPVAWPPCRRLDAAALALVGDAASIPDGMDSHASVLLNRLASYRQGSLAAYAQARPLFERALTIYEAALGPDHPDTAVNLNNFALLLQVQGDLAGARPLFERALRIRETLLGPDHPYTAVSLNNLALLMHAQGDLAGAGPMFERALAICETRLGPDHPDTTRGLNNLALLLQDQGNLAEARPLLERVLAIRETALGPDHPDTATSLNNLASLLQDQGDLAGARPLFERALPIWAAALGPNHPTTATSLNNLALLLQAQGDLASARPLLERALMVRETVLGPNHNDTAQGFNNLALLLQDQGDLAGARPLFERALAIYEAALGPDHPTVAISLNNLALLLRLQGDLARGRPLLERALAIRETALGLDHPDTATSLNNLALLLQDQGNLAGARPLLERALAIREKALGRNHPHTAQGLNNLASLLQAQGDLAGGRPLFERALAIREAALGPDHPDTAVGLNNLAALLRDQGDLAGARPRFERALAILDKALGHNHPSTHRCGSAFAWLLLATGEAANAAELGAQALAAHQAVLGTAHAWTKDSATVTARALAACGRAAEAAELRQRYGIG